MRIFLGVNRCCKTYMNRRFDVQTTVFFNGYSDILIVFQYFVKSCDPIYVNKIHYDIAVCFKVLW